MSIEIINRKYRSVNGANTLGIPNNPDWLGTLGEVEYKMYPKGAIIYKVGGHAKVILNSPVPFFNTWARFGLCDGIGIPLQDSREIGDGVGWFQDFEAGIMFWNPDLNRPNYGTFIRRGPFMEKWGALGRESGDLGYPINNEAPITTDISNLRVKRQLFQNGFIMIFEKVDDGQLFCFAFTNDGETLPRRNYTLTLEKIKCIKESKGLGSDETGISIVTTPSNDDSIIERWFHGDTDSGEEFELNRTLYDGNLPASLAFSLVGFEKDGPRAFNDAKLHFENTLVAMDDTFDRDEFLDGASEVIVASAGIGLIIGFAAAGGSLAIASSVGAGAGLITLVGTGGAAAGGLIVAAAAVVIAGVVYAALAWKHPELLMINRSVYLGETIAGFILSGMPPTEPIRFSDQGVDVSISYERRDANSFIEKREYHNGAEKSRYELTLVHQLQL